MSNATEVRIRNPFVPGVGEPPPFMGRRPDVDRALADVLDMLAKPSDPRARFLYMYGPRGTGKTVQLNALRHQVRTRPNPDILLNLGAAMVGTEDGMHRFLSRPTVEMTGAPTKRSNVR